MRLIRLSAIVIALLFAFAANAKIPVQINSGNPTVPFPQFKAYDNGTEQLKNIGSHPVGGLSLDSIEQSIRDAYQIMMNRAEYTGKELDGVKYISFSGSVFEDGTSESFGLALQAAAYMADKTTFDGLWVHFHDYFLPNTKTYLDCTIQIEDKYSDLPHFLYNSDMSGSNSGCDVNIANALLVAYKQWGDYMGINDYCGNAISYRKELTKILHALTDTIQTDPIGKNKYTSGDIGMDGYVKSGVTWGESTSWSYDNPLSGTIPAFSQADYNYLDGAAPAFFREFYSVVANEFPEENWLFADQFLRAAASSDWLVNQQYNTSESALPIAGKYSITAENSAVISSHAQVEDMMWAWRNALDYVWHGNPSQTWDPETHSLLTKENSFQKDMALRYSKFLSNPQSSPWNNNCVKGEGINPFSYKKEASLFMAYDENGAPSPPDIGNWAAGSGATSALVGQNLEQMARMFRHCETIWSGTEGYLESTPNYLHGWFRLLGMLALSGNLHAPSQIKQELNIRNTVDFDPLTGIGTVTLKSYSTFPGYGALIINLPSSVVADSKFGDFTYTPGSGQFPMDGQLIAYPQIGGNSSVRLQFKLIRKAEMAPTEITVSYVDKNQTEPIESSFWIEDTRSVPQASSLTTSKNELKYKDTLTITESVTPMLQPQLFGGTPDVQFQAGMKNSDFMATYSFGLIHDAIPAYINLGNYRHVFYFYIDSDKPIDEIVTAEIIDTEGFDKSQATIEFESIPFFDNGTNKANYRAILQLPDTLVAPYYILDGYGGEPRRVRRGTSNFVRAMVNIMLKDYNLTIAKSSYSFDSNISSYDYEDMALIGIDHSRFDGVPEKIENWGPTICDIPEMTTNNVVVEEFDGHVWRVVAGNPPVPTGYATVTMVDTVPKNLKFEKFLTESIGQATLIFDPVDNIITYENPAVPYGEEVSFSYSAIAYNPFSYEQSAEIGFDATIDKTIKLKERQTVTIGGNPNIEPFVVVPTVTPASTPYTADGTIDLLISGGIEPYKVSMGYGAEYGRKAGKYSYTVTDAQNLVKKFTSTVPVSDNYVFSAFGVDTVWGCIEKRPMTVAEELKSAGTFFWSNGDTFHETMLFDFGTYSVTMTDVLGNEYKDSIVFAKREKLPFSFPEAVYQKEPFSIELDVATFTVAGKSGNIFSADGKTGANGNFSWDTIISYYYSKPLAYSFTFEATEDKELDDFVHIQAADPLSGCDDIDVLIPVKYRPLEPSVVIETVHEKTNAPGIIKVSVSEPSKYWYNGKIIYPNGGPDVFTLKNNEDTAIFEGPAGIYSIELTEATGRTAKKQVLVNGPVTVVEKLYKDSLLYMQCGEQLHQSYQPLVVKIRNTETKGVVSSYTGNLFYLTYTAPLFPTDDSFEVYTDYVYDETDDTIFVREEITRYLIDVAKPLFVTGELSGIVGGDASFKVETTGGTAPYSYLWSDGTETNLLENVQQGAYTVTVTDAAGREKSQEFAFAEGYEPVIEYVKIIDTIPYGGKFTYTFAYEEKRYGIETTKQFTGSFRIIYAEQVFELSPMHGTPTVGEVTETYFNDDSTFVTKKVVTSFYVYEKEQPDELSAEITATDDPITQNTCTAEVLPSGGTAPYKYLWSTGEETAKIEGLGAGDVFVTVTDANEATIVKGISIVDAFIPPLKLKTETYDDPLVKGTSYANVSVSGGEKPYQYLWSNGIGDNKISNLEPGEYSVTVTDAGGRKETASVTVTDVYPAELAVELSMSDDPKTENTSTAKAVVSGGVAPYSYLWSNGAETAEIVGLSAGTYSVTVTDAKQVQTDGKIEVTDVYEAPKPLAVVAKIEDAMSVSTGGSIALTISGGTEPYAVKWEMGSEENPLENIPAGKYPVKISDADNQIIDTSFTVNEYVAPVLTIKVSSTDDPKTKGTSTASVLVVEGTAPFSYLWNTGETTELLTMLSAGTYSVTVTDGNGTKATESVEVTDVYPELSVALSSTDDPKTFKTSTATATPSGGVEPYSYAWSTGATSQKISKLKEGKYSVTVTDAEKATVTDDIYVADIYPQPKVELSYTDDPITKGTSTASATASGGTPPYKYRWSNKETTATITGLNAGEYSVTVTDGAGISDVGSIFVPDKYEIIPELELVLSSTDDPLTQNTSTAKVAISGGKAPYEILWSNGATTEEITGLSAGVYSVTVTDALQTIAESKIEVTDVYKKPTPLAVTAAIKDALSVSTGGSITLTISGGTEPYAIKWGIGSDENPLENIPAGDYAVKISDALGQTIDTSFTVKPFMPPVIVIKMSSSDDPETKGTSQASVIVVDGMAPYSYLWNNGETADMLTNLSAGTYSVTVTDARGAVASESVEVTDVYPDVPELSLQLSSTDDPLTTNTSTAKVSISGGKAPYEILWSNGATAEEITGLSAGVYSVTVTDAYASKAESKIEVTDVYKKPTPLVVSAAITDAMSVSSGGSIALTISGGTEPYAIKWELGSDDNPLENIPADIYPVSISDASGQVIDTSFTVKPFMPPVLVIKMSSSDDPETKGTSTAAVSVVDGMAPYSYLWNTGETTDKLIDLSAGEYSVTVTDSRGAVATGSVDVTDVFPEVPALHVALSMKDDPDTKGTSSAHVSVTGGITPYSLLWSNGATTDDVENLSAGMMYITVTDGDQTQKVDSIKVTDVFIQPEPLAVSATVTEPQSQFLLGSISLDVNGGTEPYSYAWNTGETTSKIGKVQVNETYTVTIADSKGQQIDTSFYIGIMVDGKVTAGNQAVQSGTIVLFVDGTDEATIAQTCPIENGLFSFADVPAGTYRMLAIPSEVSINQFMPTYYKKTLDWSKATKLDVQYSQHNIEFAVIPSITQLTGNGSISGTLNVTIPDEMKTVYSISESGLGNIPVALSQYGNVVGVTYTDESGNYSFENIPEGTYDVSYVVAGQEVANMPVSITGNELNIDGVNFGTISTDIENTAVAVIAYPSPAQDILYVNYSEPIIEVLVSTNVGQSVVLPITEGSALVVESLPAGIYTAQAIIKTGIVPFVFVKE